jgi:hypothetical protein
VEAIWFVDKEFTAIGLNIRSERDRVVQALASFALFDDRRLVDGVAWPNMEHDEATIGPRAEADIARSEEACMSSI